MLYSFYGIENKVVDGDPSTIRTLEALKRGLMMANLNSGQIGPLRHSNKTASVQVSELVELLVVSRLLLSPW